MSADPQVFEVVIDEARLAAAEPDICASLVHQNRAFKNRFLPEPWPERLRKVGVFISALGAVLTVLLMGIGMILEQPRWWLTLPLFTIFVGSFLLFSNGTRLSALLDSIAPKTIAKRVRRVIADLQKKCPYTIVYAFDELGFHVEADALAMSKRVDFDDYRFAIETEHFVHLYKNKKAFAPKAVVYFNDVEQRDAVITRLQSADITIVKPTLS